MILAVIRLVQQVLGRYGEWPWKGHWHGPVSCQDDVRWCIDSLPALLADGEVRLSFHGEQPL